MSIFHNAIAEGRTREVHMNDVGFTSFAGAIRAIGTQNLNGCTAVSLFSPYGAILAHIPPVPYPSPDPGLGLRNLDTLMGRFITLYQQNSAMFPRGSTTIIVGGAVENRPTLDHHLSRIRVHLAGQGLEAPALRLYEVTFSGLRRPADGTVLIDSRSGAVAVYVEDRLVPV